MAVRADVVASSEPEPSAAPDPVAPQVMMMMMMMMIVITTKMMIIMMVICRGLQRKQQTTGTRPGMIFIIIHPTLSL